MVKMMVTMMTTNSDRKMILALIRMATQMTRIAQLPQLNLPFFLMIKMSTILRETIMESKHLKDQL